MFDLLNYTFMQTALLAILVIAPVFALYGSLVIDKQMGFFSDSLGHSLIAGIAMGLLLGLSSPTLIMGGFAILFVILFSLSKKYSSLANDTVLSIMTNVSVAIGIILLSKAMKINQFSTYLFGDLLSITYRDIIQLGIIALLAYLLFFLFYKKFFLVLLSRSVALSRGINATMFELLFMIVVAVLVTVTIQWIGVFMINAFLIIPAAASKNCSKALKSYLLNSVLMTLAASIIGLVVSFYIEASTGAMIVIFQMLFFITTLLLRKTKSV